MHISKLLARNLLLAAAATTLCLADTSYQETGDCEATHEHLYKYTAEEEYFGDESRQTFEITVYFRVFCLSAGTFKDQRAKLYELNVTQTEFGGTIMESSSSEAEEAGKYYSQKMQGMFHFVQTEDGSIPATYYSREEDEETINTKKSIVSAFQANFLGTKVKEEADPQSMHMAEYSYEASAQDIENGVLRMHRKITSGDVESYASHMPTQEVELEKEEDIVYKKGVLTKASGKVSVKLMQKENKTPEDDVEEDILEAGARRRREDDGEYQETPQDPDDITSYDPAMTTNHYESTGSYTVEMVGEQRRLFRLKRSSNGGMDLASAVENSLLAFINDTRRSMEHMGKLRRDLGDISESLETQHMNPNDTKIAHKIEALVKLEAQYGPLPDYTPAIQDVLNYLKHLLGSNDRKDVKMRMVLYFIITPEGSLPSQMALLKALKAAVSEDEVEALTLYIALVANPQPQMVAELETLISSDIHSGDPLLLAYGAIISRASPELQQRMVLFLVDRLPEAETNSTSLIHHILSLGNSGSSRISSHLIDYLGHPESDVQLTAILAMRFIMNDPSIEKSLKELLSQPQVTEDHLTMIAKALVYGSERAKVNFEEIPYSHDFIEELVAMSMGMENEELQSALAVYLRAINNPETHELLKVLKFHKNQDMDELYTNSTRFRRGKDWDQNSDVYNLVSPLATRQSDVKTYNNHLAYIWGKSFGGKDINAKVAAGGFAGVGNSGDYKLFGHAVAQANCYDRSLTILEFLILREKDSKSTVSQFYAVVMGITLKNVKITEDASVCKSLEEPIYEGKEYTIFSFTYKIFVIVGTLSFNLKATVQFTAGMYIEFCDNHGALTLGGGLSPTLTITVSAGGDLEILWVAKAGLTLAATFNYQVLPEVTTEVCYKDSTIKVKNCIGVYHQWADNTLELYAWYAWRGTCKYGWVKLPCVGGDAYQNVKKINSLSVSWDLPGTDKMTLWKTCDKSYTC